MPTLARAPASYRHRAAATTTAAAAGSSGMECDWWSSERPQRHVVWFTLASLRSAGRYQLQTQCGAKGEVGRERWPFLLRCRYTLKLHVSASAVPDSTSTEQHRTSQNAAVDVANIRQQVTSQPSSAGQHRTSQHQGGSTELTSSSLNS
jgi:hypothetical protein